jgi:enoyl-CoA hydratase/carnithine racemase
VFDLEPETGLNRAFPRTVFDDRAEEYVRKLADKSSRILQLGKGAISRVEDQQLPAALEYLESALTGVLATEDSMEGIRAFAEKRKPLWKDE